MAGYQSKWKRLSRLNRRDHDTKKIKADRERFRRGKLSLFSRSDKLFQDARKMNRDLYVFTCIFEKKGGQGKYTAYRSHSTSYWPPARDEMVSSDIVFIGAG